MYVLKTHTNVTFWSPWFLFDDILYLHTYWTFMQWSFTCLFVRYWVSSCDHDFGHAFSLGHPTVYELPFLNVCVQTHTYFTFCLGSLIFIWQYTVLTYSLNIYAVQSRLPFCELRCQWWLLHLSIIGHNGSINHYLHIPINTRTL